MSDKKPPTRMKKKELITALQAFGYSPEQLLDDEDIPLKQPALLEMFQEHQRGLKGLTILGNVENRNEDEDEDEDDIGVEILLDKENTMTSDEAEKIETPGELVPPIQTDPEWTQYILGQFASDEVDGQNPRVEGLRRIAGLFVGDLIEEGCDLVATPTEGNGFMACVKAWGVFVTPEGRTKRFEALADANRDNCYEDYATYLVAMADTRAKGRMFRNALGLRRVVSAEEVGRTLAMADDVKQGGPIHVGQINMIRLMIDRYGINIQKMLDDMGIEYKMSEQTNDIDLKSLTYENALAVATKIRENRQPNGDK